VRRRFFVEQFTSDGAALRGPAAHHLARVLRAEPGQLYELSDGQSLCLARVERVGRDSVTFTVVERLAVPEPGIDPVLLIAVVKFDRFEWALEKATELGVSAIVPLAAARSDKGLLAAALKRAARWEKILLEAAQQARCLRPPVLHGFTPPRQAFAAQDGPIRILLSEQAGAPRLRNVLEEKTKHGSALPPPPVRIALAVGPEGGWTEEEFAAAEAARFSPASLGGNILRTETAVVAALAAAHLCLTSGQN
jgi:16S rRNA (uracil1498-N3)-methyltransferase